jgi:NAD(P)-dependent dehydrogenase (short-subunit alcohol dehydrogenase family)
MNVENPVDNRAVVITDSTAGIGLAVARQLGGHGFHLVVVGRNADRGDATVQTVHYAGGTAEFEQADLTSIQDTAELAYRVAHRHPKLQALVLNVGSRFADRRTTSEGHEATPAINLLTQFSIGTDNEPFHPALDSRTCETWIALAS